MNASNAFLLDTNILVYAYDPRDRDKQERAVLVLDHLASDERAFVSVQCLSEFFNVVTRRLPEPMIREEAVVRIERLARICRVLNLTPTAVLEGCRGVVHHQMSLWDALIWAVAKLNQVPCVLTEDAKHGRFLEGVLYLNPFSPEFDLSVLSR
ncbi:MAG: PIN domain-containing protein [Chloroflexota bacterium]|nr:MAG: PIN domain-containing protein [Chloroflexota bacterium]